MKHPLVDKNKNLCTWRVFVEPELKEFLLKVFSEKGTQGYLYNLLLRRLKEECGRQKIDSFSARRKTIGSLESVAEGLRITITTKKNDNTKTKIN